MPELLVIRCRRDPPLRQDFLTARCPPDWPSATMVEVTEVPMLAPMMSEMAWRTENRSAATIVMMIDVDVDDD